MTKARNPMIRASEVGEFVYCARAWWLHRVEGLEPAGRERRERGTLLHARHGHAVAVSSALIWAGAGLLLLALALLLLWR
jgi:hypothetical protein